VNKIEELVSLLGEQMKLTGEIAATRLQETRIELMQGLSMHNRDEHNRFYDIEAALSQNKRLKEETDRLCVRFDTNQAKLSRLAAEIAA
jgi:hypothetical protein